MAQCSWPNGLPSAVSLTGSTGDSGCASPITDTLTYTGSNGSQVWQSAEWTFRWESVAGNYQLYNNILGIVASGVYAAVVVCCDQPNGPMIKFNNVKDSNTGSCRYTVIITGPACSQPGGGQ